MRFYLRAHPPGQQELSEITHVVAQRPKPAASAAATS